MSGICLMAAVGRSWHDIGSPWTRCVMLRRCRLVVNPAPQDFLYVPAVHTADWIHLAHLCAIRRHG